MNKTLNILYLSILVLILTACGSNFSEQDAINFVKQELQKCPAPVGATDLWFKHYGVGDLERANIVVTSGGYIQMNKDGVPYVVWPSGQTRYDWFLGEAGGILQWKATKNKSSSTVAKSKDYWLVEAEGGPNLVHDPTGIIAGSQDVVLPVPLHVMKNRNRPVRRATLYPPIKVYADSDIYSDYECVTDLLYPDLEQ